MQQGAAEPFLSWGLFRPGPACAATLMYAACSASPTREPAEGSKTQLGATDYEFEGKKKKRSTPSPSSLLTLLAGVRKNEEEGSEKKT